MSFKTRDSEDPVEIDCRGLLCPLPVIEARKALHEVEAGNRVVVICTDPASRLDLEVYCATSGHLLRSVEEGEGEWRFCIERASSPVG